jgi:hypothetical protein
MSGDRFKTGIAWATRVSREVKTAREVRIGDTFVGSGQTVIEIRTDPVGIITFVGDGPLGVKLSRPTPPDADCWVEPDKVKS